MFFSWLIQTKAYYNLKQKMFYYTTYTINIPIISWILIFKFLSNIIYITQTPKVKPEIKCNTFWRCILYTRVMKLPKLASFKCAFTHELLLWL